MIEDVGPEFLRKGEAREAPDDEEGLLLAIKGWVRADIEQSAEWRRAAKAEYDFVAGHGQWSEADRKFLAEQKRPVFEFNKTLKFVRAICGLEVNNRQQITYLPREVDNAAEVKANELLTAASEWMSQGCQAHRHQSRAFRDLVICGMGWTESVIDYDEDRRGKYVERRINPLEMGWDCDARDDNLRDAKRVWRLREMLRAEAEALIPGVTDRKGYSVDDLDAAWTTDISPIGNTLNDLDAFRGRQDLSDVRRKVRILQIQWWEMEPYRVTVDPQTGAEVEMSEADYRRAARVYKGMTGLDLPSAKLMRRVYKQALVGGKVLHVGPCPRSDGFTFACMTGEPDDNHGNWYGMVRLLRDPQVWENKFFSQMMHMINATAKGGILAESDAFPDIRQAQETYARADAITVVNPGAIAKNKIMPKPGAAITGGILQLMQITNSLFSETTGMNLELMGMADRQQPGILEAQRKQAAMTILATLFDSLSSYREDVGRIRLNFIQRYLADDRIIRVHGEDGYQAMPLLKDETMGQYDVIVDDAPESTNMKERTWMALSMILPSIQSMLTPQTVAMLLDYVPGLPSRLVMELKKVATQEPDPEALQLQQRQAVASVEEAEARAMKAKTGAVLDLARAAAERAKARQEAIDADLSALGLIDGDPAPMDVAPDDVALGSEPVAQFAPPMVDADSQMMPQPQPSSTPMTDVVLPNGLRG